MRLNKFLSQMGVASRRAIDEMIARGAILVNGKSAKLGCLYEKGSQITIEGKPLVIQDLPDINTIEVMMLHKPTGVICTHSDDEGRVMAINLIPYAPKVGKWIMIGRLDIQSSGLLFFTNYGELASKLMHPSSQIKRIYEVKVQGVVTKAHLDTLQSGIVVEGEKLTALEAVLMESTATNTWVKIVMLEGKNREIRRMFESLHLNVLKLQRVQFGPIKLDGLLKHGEARKCTQDEIKRLIRAAKMKV